MPDLTEEAMVRGYLTHLLVREFQYSKPQQKVVFTCKDPKIFDMMVAWLNSEPKGITFFSSTNFRMVVVIGACPRTFFLKLLYPKKIEVTMMQ